MKIYLSIFSAFLLSAGTIFAVLSWIKYHKIDQLNDAPTTSIIGGVTATEGEFPFAANIRYKDVKAEYCGGSIIGSKWILTAAHCVDKKFDLDYYKEAAYFLVGTNNLQVGGTAHNITNIVYHPDGYDIALIELGNEIQFNNKTRAIVLSRSNAPDNSSVTAIGWGKISNADAYPISLQKIELHTISLEKCCQIESCDEELVDYESMVCTLAPFDKGTCKGDSGGALIFNNTQVGVLSYGSKTCAIRKPDIFMSVQYFYKWIHNYTSIV